MDHQKIIAAVAEEVKKALAGAESGHDWWHAFMKRYLKQFLEEWEGGGI